MPQGRNHPSGNDLKVLLVGYNGANNTGSEARLLAIIDDVRAVFGPTVHITVPTLNEQNLRRYLKEDPYLTINPVPSIFYFALRRAVKEHDLILLVEGSCFMDTWTSVLLTAFLWTIHYAHKADTPVIAYAVDAGTLSPRNTQRVLHELDHLDQFIIRSQTAANYLHDLGYTKPIQVTADCAYTYQPTPPIPTLQEVWPQAKGGIIGLAPVDFYLWPVHIRLWGPSDDCYRWPYYYPRSKDRRQGSDRLADGWAHEMDRLVDTYHKHIAILCMEELDEPLAHRIHQRMRHHDHARVFSARTYNASQMTGFLRSLDFLITSRYHASILSMPKPVPLIAVGHDTRLHNLFQDLNLYPTYFVDSTTPHIWDDISHKADMVLHDPTPLITKLKDDYTRQLTLAHQNRHLLKAFAKTRGWTVTP